MTSTRTRTVIVTLLWLAAAGGPGAADRRQSGAAEG